MIRRDNRSSGDEGFRTVAKSNNRESKLEAKKRRVQESSIRPEVRRVDDLAKSERERLRGSSLPNDEDEKPTGYLDDEDVASQEETPTGYLEDEEKELPKLKVTKVTGRGENTQRRTDYREEPKEVEDDKVAQFDQSRQVRKATPQRRQNTQQRPRRRVENYPEGKDARLGFTDDTPEMIRNPERVPKVERENYENNPPVPRTEKQVEEPRKKGSGGRVVLLLLVFFVVMIIAVGVLFFLKIAGRSESGTGSTVSTFSTDIYTELVSEVDNLYVDSNKCDIRESVSDADIQRVVSLLGQYKDSSSYVESVYDLVSQEIGTISFYLQDRKIYNDLVNGVYTVGSEEYEENFKTVENDIYLYTVSGLEGTMRTKLEILKTTNGVVTPSTDAGDVSGMGVESSSSGNSDGGITIFEPDNQVVEEKAGSVEEEVINEGTVSESTGYSNVSGEELSSKSTEKTTTTGEEVSSDSENTSGDLNISVTDVLNVLSKD